MELVILRLISRLAANTVKGMSLGDVLIVQVVFAGISIRGGVNDVETAKRDFLEQMPVRFIIPKILGGELQTTHYTQTIINMTIPVYTIKIKAIHPVISERVIVLEYLQGHVVRVVGISTLLARAIKPNHIVDIGHFLTSANILVFLVLMAGKYKALEHLGLEP